MAARIAERCTNASEKNGSPVADNFSALALPSRAFALPRASELV